MNDLVMVDMIQNAPTGGSPDVQALSRTLVYQALVNPKK